MSRPERKISVDKLNEIRGKFEELFKKDSDTSIPKGDLFNFLEVEGIINSPESAKQNSYIGGKLKTSTDRYSHILALLESIFPSDLKKEQYEVSKNMRYALRTGVKSVPGAVGGAIRSLFGKKSPEVAENKEASVEPEAATGLNKWFLDVFFTEGQNLSPLEDLFNANPKNVLSVNPAEMSNAVVNEQSDRMQFIRDLRVATLQFICQRFDCNPEDIRGAGNSFGYNISDNLIVQCNEKIRAELNTNFDRSLTREEWQSFLSKISSENEIFDKIEYDQNRSCKTLLRGFFTKELISTILDNPLSVSGELEQLQKSVLEYFCEKFKCTVEDVQDLYKEVSISNSSRKVEEREKVVKVEETPVVIHHVTADSGKVVKTLKENLDDQLTNDDWVIFSIKTMNDRSSYRNLKGSGFLASTQTNQSVKDFLENDFFGKTSLLQSFLDQDIYSQEKIKVVQNLRVAVVEYFCDKFQCTANDIKNAGVSIGDEVINEVDGIGTKPIPRKSSTLKPLTDNKENTK